MTPPLLTHDLMNFLHGGRLLTLATCDAFNTPAIAPVLACNVEADRCTVIVVLAKSHASRLLTDIAAHSLVTLLASQAGSTLQLQIQGQHAKLIEVGGIELASLAVQRESLAAELLPLGFASQFGYALSDYSVHDIVAIKFQTLNMIRPTADVAATEGWQ